MSGGSALLERLEWDSRHFGFEIARVRAETLSPADAGSVVEEAKSRGVRCVYCLADPADPETWKNLIAVGFRPVDIRLELERETGEGTDGPVDCALASKDDFEALVPLARGAFADSRFFRDPEFPEERAKELFSIWLRKGLEDPAFFTLIDRGESGVAGFITGSVGAEGSGRIELGAVSPGSRGRGVARRLVRDGLSLFRRRGSPRVSVVTQGSNLAAQRLYQNSEFRSRRMGLWFHLWL